jgi:hypothetical protein
LVVCGQVPCREPGRVLDRKPAKRIPATGCRPRSA